jgi:hypothetical protein
MSDLIKITEAEHERLFDLLPDAIRSMQLYKQPALNDFRVDYVHTNGGHTRFTYGRSSDTTKEWFKNEVPIEKINMSTLITCAFQSVDADGNRNPPAYMAFGFLVDDPINIAMFTPKTPYWNQLEKQGIMQEQSECMVWLYEAIQYLLLHHKELLQFSITTEPNKHSGKKKGGKAKKGPPKKTRLYRFVHMSDEEAEEFKKMAHAEHEKRKIERHCEAWGVRGHYRHYKSGKVAYIKPHVRGKEKEKYTGREYTLFPKSATRGEQHDPY